MKTQSFSQTIPVIPFGGPGSGDWGHAGRQGHIGGSSKGRGSAKSYGNKGKGRYSQENLRKHSKKLRDEREGRGGHYSKKELEQSRRITKEADRRGYSWSEAFPKTNPRIPTGDNFAPGIGWY